MDNAGKKISKTTVACIIIIIVCAVLCVLVLLQSNHISKLEQQSDSVYATQQQSLTNAAASQIAEISQQNSKIQGNESRKENLKKQIASYENEIAKASTTK